MTNIAIEPFDVIACNAALAGTPFAGMLQHFEEIDSTNTRLMREGAAGAAHGTVYIADAQTGGRGRGAHTWSSPPGSGLYVSVLLRPQIAPRDALWFSLAAGLAAQSAVAETAGFTPDLRWPNDLLAGARKLGGILTELQAEVTRVRFLVIGVGINVHQQAFPPELASSATSLAIEAPSAAARRENLLVALLRAIASEASALSGSDTIAAQRSLLRRLETQSSWVRGKHVMVGEEDVYSGVTEGLDAQGFLRVRAEDGSLRTVHSGGVRAWEKP